MARDFEMGNTPLNPDGQEWSRRQFLIGAGGLTVVALGALFAKSGVAQIARSLTGVPISQGLTKVYTGDYYYVPNHMTWKVGDNVSMLFTNESPNRFHEMMIGRGFDTTPSIFGDVKTQFHEDFWDGVHVTVADADGVDNLATNKAIVQCDVNPHPWLITAPGNGNFSPTLMPSGHILLNFTVPNKPGVWEYACFVQGFVHYRAGMRGVIHILPA